MSEAVEWATFALRVLGFLVSTAFSVLGILLMLQLVRVFWSFYSEGRRGDVPSVMVLLRRVWCRHRVLARTRTRYGYRVLLCAACGSDVNRNRPVEMRR